MIQSVLKSLFFIIAYTFLYIQIFRTKKSGKVLNGSAWICITFILTLWINIFIGEILSLIHIPINLWSIGVIYCGIGLFLLLKEKDKQIYKWSVQDVFSFLGICLLSLYIGIKQHGIRLRICYITSDPAVHLKLANQLIKNGKIEGMDYAALNNGLFLDLFSPFLGEMQQYKIFILADIIMFAVSGLVFYSIIRESLAGRKQLLWALIMTVVYMLGYPLNNKLYGFVYLGMGVTIIAVVVYCLKLYMEDAITQRLAVWLLMLGCNAMVMCYMLFAPVVYFSIFFSLVYKHRKKLISLNFASLCLKIFLYPCIMAVYFCYIKYFLSRGIAPGGAIAANGAIYGEFYANYVFFMPIVIYAIIIFLKEKTNVELLFFFTLFAIFLMGLIILVIMNKSSYYYFYKVHHVIWLFVCWIMTMGTVKLWHVQKEIFISYAIVIIGLFILWYKGIDAKIASSTAEFGYSNGNDSFLSAGFSVYKFNFVVLVNSSNWEYDKRKIKLYEYVYNNLPDENVPIFCDGNNYTDVYWYEAILKKDYNGQYAWQSDEYTRIFVNKDVKYIITFKENPLYKEHKKEIKEKNILYKNSLGYVVEVN